MSAIDELIAELCPDGVERHRFSDVCTLKARVGWQRLTKAEQMPTGDYMLVTGTDFTPSNEVDYGTCSYVSKNRYDQDENIQLKNGDVLITKDGTLGKVAIVGNLPKPATLNGGVFVVRSKDGKLYNRYIAHYLQSSYFKRAVDSQKTGSTISHLTQGLFSRLEIPVPPIEVQREVVRILDTFAELTDTLTEELEARKAQYAYYRDRLLSREGLEALDGKPVETVRLGEVIQNLRTGLNPRKNFKLNTLDATNNYITVRELDGMDFKIDQKTDRVNDAGLELILKRAAIKRNDILFSGTGTIGNTALVKETPTDWGIKEGVYAISPDVETVRPKFLIYLFHTTACKKWFERKAMGGAVKSVSMADLKMLPIPVPSLAAQQKVVDILDRFDDLTTSLTDGLPAEIEARKAQYGYYRDRLLDFPKKEVAAS